MTTLQEFRVTIPDLSQGDYSLICFRKWPCIHASCYLNQLINSYNRIDLFDLSETLIAIDYKAFLQ
jgi:hypothetical protein